MASEQFDLLRPRHPGGGPQPRVPRGVRRRRRRLSPRPSGAGSRRGSSAAAPLSFASNATSDSTGSDGSDSGSSGSPSSSTHEVQPPYASRYGTASGSSEAVDPQREDQSGSRRFQWNRVSTYARDQTTLPSSASSTSRVRTSWRRPRCRPSPRPEVRGGGARPRWSRRPSAGTRASAARVAGARRVG